MWLVGSVVTEVTRKAVSYQPSAISLNIAILFLGFG